MSIAVFLTALLMMQTDSLQRNVGILVLDRRNTPVEGIILYTQSPSSSQGVTTDKEGYAVLNGISDTDTLYAILPDVGAAAIPLCGVDSLKITLKAGNRYKVKSILDTRTTPVSVLEDVPALLRTTTVSSLADLLQGRVPGLNITRTLSGDMMTNIRGINSLYGSSEPLVILDGMEVGTLSDADKQISVYDIQSITVDKDGSMYGVRGGNGVIKIKTIGSTAEMY